MQYVPYGFLVETFLVKTWVSLSVVEESLLPRLADRLFQLPNGFVELGECLIEVFFLDWLLVHLVDGFFSHIYGEEITQFFEFLSQLRKQFNKETGEQGVLDEVVLDCGGETGFALVGCVGRLANDLGSSEARLLDSLEPK